MGKVTELSAHRGTEGTRRGGARSVHCTHCGERHPSVRLAGGVTRYVTAFRDGDLWFCRNRGCRAAWLRDHE
jgi:hypothetical protein